MMTEAAQRLDVQAVLDGRRDTEGYVRWFADEVKRRADAAARTIDDIANLREPFDAMLLQRATVAHAELLALGSGVDRIWEGRFSAAGYFDWKVDVVDYVWSRATPAAAQLALVESWFARPEGAPAPDGR